MSGKNVAQKLIESHLLEGRMEAGEEIALRMDQTLTQDATGTMVMLELEAMGLTRAKTEVSVQYIDHNLLQTDFKNPDDHVFLRSACRKFGLWYSRPGKRSGPGSGPGSGQGFHFGLNPSLTTFRQILRSVP